MTPESFLRECEKRRIRLWLEGIDPFATDEENAANTSLQVAAPPGTLTPAVLTAIRAAKPALVELLAAKIVKPADKTELLTEWEPLSLFEDADLLHLALHWEDRRWCESRVGDELVILCDGNASFGFASDANIRVYRLPEIAALRKRAITKDGLPLHCYHADKRAFSNRADPAAIYTLKTSHAGRTERYFFRLCEYAEIESPGFTARSKVLLSVLAEAGWIVWIDTESFRLATGNDRSAVFAGVSESNLPAPPSARWDEVSLVYGEPREWRFTVQIERGGKCDKSVGFGRTKRDAIDDIYADPFLSLEQKAVLTIEEAKLDAEERI